MGPGSIFGRIIKKGVLIVALALIIRANAFSQVWVYSLEHSMNDDECFELYDAIEMTNGNVALSSIFYYKSGAGDFYSAQPAVTLLSANGQEMARKDYFRPGYCTTSYAPYLFENNGRLFALMTYSPDHDSTYFNYFKNYDDPPADAVLGLYKLDSDLDIEESFEHSYVIDTFECRSEQWENNPNEHSGNLFLFSAFEDDGEIVGAYFKMVSHDYFNPRGHDTLFLFRMNFNGEIIQRKGYEWHTQGGMMQWSYRRNHFVKTDSHYIFFAGSNQSGHQGTAFYYDKDFNLVRTRYMDHVGQPTSNSITNISVKRSLHNTTYLVTSSVSNVNSYIRDVRLYELDDDIANPANIIPFVQHIERKTDNYDLPAILQSADLAENNTLFFAYTLNVGFYDNQDSWMMVERLDADLDTITTCYYDIGPDKRINSHAQCITAARDGGVLLVSRSKNLDDTNQRWTTITKFPAEAFEGIEEAHDNGLKVAVAYPNPGKDVLNIRTGLKDAWVEVYDMSGRMVYRQEITENITSINAEGWPAGSYVWKVVADTSTGSGTLAETGKWIKE